LAEHTKNIDVNEKASLLVTEQSTDIQAAARVTLIGNCVRMVDQDTVKARYLRFFQNAVSYFDTHDFFFYRIEPKILRYIGGFGKIHWVEVSDYASPPNQLEAQEAAILTHMNNNHYQNLVDYCQTQYAKWVRNVEMIAIDCDGFDLMSDEEILRFDFPSTVHNASQARAALVEFAQKNRK